MISEWDNTVGWNFGEVQKAIDDYDRYQFHAQQHEWIKMVDH